MPVHFLYSFQVNALLHSLDIDSDARARGPLPGKFQELEDYWNESQGIIRPRPHVADGWANEFNQLRVNHGDPESWAHSFEQQHGANGWASEFEQVRHCLFLQSLVSFKWKLLSFYMFCLVENVMG